MYSHRSQRTIQLTRHVTERMAKRDVTEEMLYDLIETGDIFHKTATDVWLYKHYLNRNVNVGMTETGVGEIVILNAKKENLFPVELSNELKKVA